MDRGCNGPVFCEYKNMKADIIAILLLALAVAYFAYSYSGDKDQESCEDRYMPEVCAIISG